MLLLFLAEDVQHQPTCFGRSAKKVVVVFDQTAKTFQSLRLPSCIQYKQNDCSFLTQNGCLQALMEPVCDLQHCSVKKETCLIFLF